MKMKTARLIISALLIMSLPVFCTECTKAGFDEEQTGESGEKPGDGENPDDEGDDPATEETYYYKKVTSELQDWSGEYIITYTTDEQILVLDGFDEKYGTGNTDLIQDLTPEGIIDETGDKYKATVTVSGSGYTIYLENIGYIGYTSGSKNALSRTETGSPNPDTDIWKISFSGGLSPANAGSRSLKWNPSAPRFACYEEKSTSCIPVTLYKRTGESGETPGPGPDDPDPDEPDNPDIEDPDDKPEPQPGTGANTNGYLQNWEVPAASVALEEGEPYSRTVSESLSGGLAYVFECNDSEQLVVTHTYTDGNRRIRTYTMLFDASKKAALWVAYGMNSGEWEDNDVGRSGNWRYDPAIPQEWQSAGCTSNYHKGHQCASNDRQANKTANGQTFYYSNQTPQWQTRFNDGIWNQLENAVQNNAPSGRDTLYVATGPLYFDDKTEEDDGGKTVPIPSGYWKCLMLCSFDSNGKMVDAEGIGYYFPKNAEYTDKYANYSTTIDEVEEICGFDLFANVPEELQKKAESSTASLF